MADELAIAGVRFRATGVVFYRLETCSPCCGRVFFGKIVNRAGDEARACSACKFTYPLAYARHFKESDSDLRTWLAVTLDLCSSLSPLETEIAASGYEEQARSFLTAHRVEREETEASLARW